MYGFCRITIREFAGAIPLKLIDPEIIELGFGVGVGVGVDVVDGGRGVGVGVTGA